MTARSRIARVFPTPQGARQDAFIGGAWAFAYLVALFGSDRLVGWDGNFFAWLAVEVAIAFTLIVLAYRLVGQLPVTEKRKTVRERDRYHEGLLRIVNQSTDPLAVATARFALWSTEEFQP